MKIQFLPLEQLRRPAVPFGGGEQEEQDGIIVFIGLKSSKEYFKKPDFTGYNVSFASVDEGGLQ